MTRAKKKGGISDHMSDALIFSLLYGVASYAGAGIIIWHMEQSFRNARFQFIAVFLGSLTFSISFMFLQSVAHGPRSLGFRYARSWLPLVLLSGVGIYAPTNAILWISLMCGCGWFGYLDAVATNRRVVARF